MKRNQFVLVTLVLLTIGVMGFLVSRSPRVRSWFARDSENANEIARLGDTAIQVLPVADTATGWFQWRGPTRDGRAPEGPFRSDWEARPPAVLWRAECGGGYSSCTVVGDRLYTQDRRGDDERVICLSCADGKLLWEFGYPAPQAGKDRQYAIGPRATPTVEGQKLYAVGGAGKFVCLELPQGENNQPRLLWQHDLLTEFEAEMPQWGVACSPLIEGELAIVQPGGRKGSVVAFDKQSGELRWASGSTPGAYSSPVISRSGNATTIIAFTQDSLLALKLDGTIADTFAWNTVPEVNAVTPLIADDYVFISSAYGMGSALLRVEVKSDSVALIPVYSRRGPRGFKNHHASSVLKDRHLYGFDDSRLKCVAFDTGLAIPDWDSADVGKGSLILVKDYLVIQTERGDLCLVEATPEEFRLVAKLRGVLSGNNNWATPTLVDGRLYLRDEKNVVCYDVRP